LLQGLKGKIRFRRAVFDSDDAFFDVDGKDFDRAFAFSLAKNGLLCVRLFARLVLDDFQKNTRRPKDVQDPG
jgi:hypothetical protein